MVTGTLALSKQDPAISMDNRSSRSITIFDLLKFVQGEIHNLAASMAWHNRRAGGGLPCILVIGQAALTADFIG